MKKPIGKNLIFAILLFVMLAQIFCQENFVFARAENHVNHDFLSEKKVCNAMSVGEDSENSLVQKTRNYGVVFVKFADSDDFDEGFEEKIFKTYNTSSLSVKKYFEIVSNGLYSVDFLAAATTVVTLTEKQSYYEPKYYYTPITGRYETVNENGYDNRYFDENGEPCSYSKTGNKRHIDRLLREQTMFKEIVSKVAQSFSGANLDFDGNGVIDGLHLIFSTQDKEYSWDEILWAHKGKFTAYNKSFLENNYYVPSDFEILPIDFLPSYIDNKVADGYSVFTSTKIKETVIQDENKDKIFSCGIFAHEMMHDLGLSDYYSYDKTGESGELYENKPVGEFDILGGAQLLPQMPLSYTRQKLGFITDENICPIEKGGEYLLYPTTSDAKTKAYKLVLNDYNETGEYFMIEARSGGGFVDGSLSGTGIIVYRISEKDGFIGADGTVGVENLGNMYGENEVYVYRLGDKDLSDNKNNSFALLDGNTLKINADERSVFLDGSTMGSRDKSAYKTVIDQNTGYLTTSIFYTDGQNSGVKISDVKVNEDGSCSFKIEFDEGIFSEKPFADLSRYYDNKTLIVKWGVPTRQGKVCVYTCSANGLIKYKNGEYVLKKKITPAMLAAGNVHDNEVFFKGEFAASYCTAVIPDTKDETAVFLTYEINGESKVLFAGVFNSHEPSFSEYLFGTTKWVVLIIGIVVFFVAVTVVVILLMVKKEKSKNATESDKDEVRDLEKLYGENYWLKEENFDETTQKDGEDVDADLDESEVENSENENNASSESNESNESSVTKDVDKAVETE